MIYNIISEGLKEDVEPGKKYTIEEVPWNYIYTK